ncbi:hypothetical protein KBT16_03690, partial [Nostoc sp. CCCryo 231-06]|nr:hypothetical protein [Nostoc sp. CCCryo 231-06]
HSIWRKIDLKQQSRLRLGSPLSAMKILAPPSSSPINPSSHQVMTSAGQPSADRYQRQRLELDSCRLAFAKELARNGKFRKAIAMAEQISETSHLFKDAQLLIRNWQKY